MNNGGVICWFRHDLRLDDNAAWTRAVALAREHHTWLLPVVLTQALDLPLPWGPGPARGLRQQAWWHQARLALRNQLQARGSDLVAVPSVDALRQLALGVTAGHLVAEAIRAPYEQEQVKRLNYNAPWDWHSLWQSTLVAPKDLPFAPEEVPRVFTSFRQKLEAAGVRSSEAQPAPQGGLPPMPDLPKPAWPDVRVPPHDRRSSVQADRNSGEAGARAHWQALLDQGLPKLYLETRNQLSGANFSSQLSLDLATGALSARRAVSMLDDYEQHHGRSKSSYWIWFELMWRDHFRWLHWRYGATLYRARGLAEAAPRVSATPEDWQRWCQGETSAALVNAGMRELLHTGYLSNRMRQIVASFWVNEMGGDWRAGAAWFQSQLLDEDVYSNHGNWAYIAGVGSDPRGGRRFDPDKQAAQHDPQGRYQRMWLTPCQP